MSAVKKAIKSKATAVKGKLKKVTAGAGLDSRAKESIKKSKLPALRKDPVRKSMSNEFYKPKKELLTLRVDADVLTYFRGTGAGYQAKMNHWLKAAMLEGLMRAKNKQPEVTPFQGGSEALPDNVEYRSKKLQMSLRLDSDVVGWYRAKGKGYQTVMNRHLRLAMLESMHSDSRV